VLSLKRLSLVFSSLPGAVANGTTEGGEVVVRHYQTFPGQKLVVEAIERKASSRFPHQVPPYTGTARVFS
jgi:hypothetical protein